MDLALTAVFALPGADAGAADLPPGAEVWPMPPDVAPALDLARAGYRPLRVALDDTVSALNSVMRSCGWQVPVMPPALLAAPPERERPRWQRACARRPRRT